MKSGLTSYAYAWAIGVPGFAVPAQVLTPRALLHRAAYLGLETVQLCDNLPLFALGASARRALADEASALGLRLEVGGRGLTPENLSRHLALCRDLGADLLRFVIDAPGHHPALEEFGRWLGPQLDECATAGVALAIENHDRFRAEQLAAFVSSLDHAALGICLDTANSLGAGEGFATVFETLAPHTLNLHVKDVVVERFPHQLGFTVKGCAAGRGVIAPLLPAALTRLRALGRCRSVLLESWPEPGPDLAETLAREHAWAEQGAAWLRPFLHA